MVDRWDKGWAIDHWFDIVCAVSQGLRGLFPWVASGRCISVTDSISVLLYRVVAVVHLRSDLAVIGWQLNLRDIRTYPLIPVNCLEHLRVYRVSFSSLFFRNLGTVKLPTVYCFHRLRCRCALPDISLQPEWYPYICIHSVLSIEESSEDPDCHARLCRDNCIHSVSTCWEILWSSRQTQVNWIVDQFKELWYRDRSESNHDKDGAAAPEECLETWLSFVG